MIVEERRFLVDWNSGDGISDDVASYHWFTHGEMGEWSFGVLPAREKLVGKLMDWVWHYVLGWQF